MATRKKTPSPASRPKPDNWLAPKKPAPKKRSAKKAMPKKQTKTTPVRKGSPKDAGGRAESGVARAEGYVSDILHGRLAACEWVVRACERQQRDLARKSWRYHWDPERAERIVRFVEALRHVKGRQFAGNNIVLEPWQCFILTTVFGWVDDSGLRRFRTAYVEVPRKNGKSTMTSPVGLYMLAADGEPGAEVYSAATVRDQAKIIWGDARLMTLRSPGFREALGVDASMHSIFIQENGSFFKSLSRDQQGNLDGLNVHCALIDELHGHKDRGVWDVLETATGARVQPLLWAITTAGSNRAGICYEQRMYVQKILQKQHDDETYFGIIYTIDKNDDPFDPATWQKANPNYGVSVSPDDLERKASKARQMAAALNNFLTKHLNVWVNADSPWMNMKAWDACADTSLDREDFVGEECILALDLATKTDIAAKLYLFIREDDEGVPHYYVFGDYFLPEEALDEDRNASYSGWARSGHLNLVPGNATDFKIIEDSVRNDAEQFYLVQAAFDPWQAAHMMQNLGEEGLPVAKYKQTVENMSTPMKEVEALVLNGQLHHDGNPVLSWMMSNVVCHEDAKENIYPRKDQKQKKIDGAVALIMAVGCSMLRTRDNDDFSSFLDSPVM